MDFPVPSYYVNQDEKTGNSDLKKKKKKKIKAIPMVCTGTNCWFHFA